MSRAQDLENAVEQLLIFKKIKFMRVSNYRCFKCGQVQNRSAKGWPDFFGYDPILVGIECKTGAGKLTKEQESVRESFIRNDVPYIIVRDNVDALLIFLQQKTRPKAGLDR